MKNSCKTRSQWITHSHCKYFVVPTFNCMFLCLIAHATTIICLQVSSLTNEHKCTSSGRRKTTTPTGYWVASLALPILTKKPYMGAKELQTTLQDKHICTITYETVWKGKEKVLTQLYETWEESFQLLFRWREAVLEKMPDPIIEFDLHEDDDGNLEF
jgi:hypothetical protein